MEREIKTKRLLNRGIVKEEDVLNECFKKCQLDTR